MKGASDANGGGGEAYATDAPVFSDLEITILEKLPHGRGDNNQLTKTISANGSGGYTSDGSPCRMSRGKAQRRRLGDLYEFADMLGQLEAQHALVLGRLLAGLPDHVKIIRAEELKDDTPHGTIARTQEYFGYAPGKPALALIDTDYKGATAAVRDRIAQAGGLQAALIAALPALADAYRVVRPSTSSGLVNTETGEQLLGSQNAHTYVVIADGADVEHFLKTLHKRCWLAGFGWHFISTAGVALERSPIDQSVFSPERLVFEGPPVVIPPLKQNPEARQATVLGSNILDTRVACPDLSKEEQAKYDRTIVEARERIAPEVDMVREEYIGEEAAKLVKEKKLSEPEARAVVERRCSGVLLASDTLPWDDRKLAGVTVADILRNPKKHQGKTLADPLEGPSYGTGKAKVVLRPDNGRPMITSFAHGKVNYWLKWDYAAIAAAIEQGEPAEAAAILAQHLNDSKHVEITNEERERLVGLASARSGLNIKDIEQALKGGDPGKLEQMNKEHHVVSLGGKTLVLTWDLEDEIYPRRPIATYRTSTEFRKFYNKWVYTWTKDGAPVLLGDWWWNHPKRRQYSGIVYAPNTDKEIVGTKLNLWRGFTVEPSAAGSCQLYLDHLRDNICVNKAGKPVPAYYEYLIGWMAYCVQHPERQGQVAVVLIGPKGSGKTVGAEEFGKTFGTHYVAITNSEHLTGRFNAHMQACSVLLPDECFFAGDPKHDRILKTLITGDRIFIEPKGVNGYAVKNNLHIWMCTNSDWAVPTGHDERRYFVLWVGQKHLQDIPYFRAMCEQMDNGGRAALLHMLLNLDLNTYRVGSKPFEVRNAPKTDALRDQQARSRDGVDALLEDMLMNGEVMFSHDAAPYVCVTSGKEQRRGFDHYIETEAHPDLRRLGPLRVKHVLKSEWECKHWRGYINGNRVWGIEFPPLEEMRAMFEKKHGAIAWPVEGDEWVATNRGLPFVET